ncbi:MAG: hypothetical protein OJF49_003261 [Ktedonobacterales bacterium]|jgi:putative copper export protein|nr:MAG: hypothetical protein OJF49_003261 [Ktedonobacterales bacterium]
MTPNTPETNPTNVSAPAPTSSPSASAQPTTQAPTATATTPTPAPTPAAPSSTIAALKATWRDRIMRAALLTILATRLIALITTYLAVHAPSGSLYAYEANPAMAGIWSHFSYGATILIELAAAAFILLNTLAQYPHLPRTARAITIGIALLSLADATNDTLALLRLHIVLSYIH